MNSAAASAPSSPSAPSAPHQGHLSGPGPALSPIWQGMIPLSRHVPDPTDPRAGSVAAWGAWLLGDAARRPSACPRCGRLGPLSESLAHLLGEHDASYAEAARWLEDSDPDLHALAVHYLAGKERAGGREEPRCASR